MSEHPSFLRLDRHALGGAVDREVAEHVASCAECARHVALASRAVSEAPAWIAETRGGRKVWGWPMVLAPLAAAIAAAFLYLGEPYVGSKGAPSVELYVKRGDEVARWRGEAVHPGDALRLELIAAGYANAAVLDAEGHVFHRGATSEGALPLSLIVDDQGDRERIAIIFSHTPLDDAALARAAAAGEQSDAIYTIAIELKKVSP